MGVGSKDHIAAGGKGLTCILVDDRLVCRNIDAAIFLCGAKAEHVVVLVDGSAHCAQGVVAVCHSIRQGEFLQAAGTSRLDDAHVRDVVAHHGVKADVKFVTFGSVHVMRPQNLISDSVLTGLVFA